MKQLQVLLVAFLMVLVVSWGQAQVLIVNEFMASNDSSYADENGEYDDWIEIFNPGPNPVDIGGMYITDDLADPTAWQIPTTAPDSTTIPAGGFLVLWADKQPEQGVLHVNIKLSSGGEQIGLFASDGVTPIDTLTFGAQITDSSYGRYPDGSDTWMIFNNPTPGYTNRPIPVIVNEFMASNDFCCADEHGEYDDWIELFNAGVKAVDIGGMYITDDLAAPTTWQIPTTAPDTTTIEPGGFLVLWADKQSEQGVLHVEIKLSGKGEQIGLFASDGATVVDTLTFGPQQSDTSYGRLFDGGNAWAFFSAPTPGESNSAGTIVGITDASNTLVSDYALSSNYPNPFNPVTTITYRLPEAQRVRIVVYNTLGQEVKTLLDEVKPAGVYRLQWDGRDSAGNPVSSGLYFYRMTAGNFHSVHKMLLVR